MQSFSPFAWLLLVHYSALAMKSFAEVEQQNGTLQWLFLNQSISIVSGSFFQIFGWDLVLTSFIGLPLLVYVLGVPAGNLDLGATLEAISGITFLIAAFFWWFGFWQVHFPPNQIMACYYVFLNFILYFGIEQLSISIVGRGRLFPSKSWFFIILLPLQRGLIDTQRCVLLLLVIEWGVLFLAKCFLEEENGYLTVK